MKRKRVWLLSALLAANLLLPALAADPTVCVSAEKKELMSGEEIEVTLALDQEMENAGALEYRLQFDTEVLEYVGGSPAEDTNPAMHVIKPAAGRMYAGALFSYDYTRTEGSVEEKAATRIPAGNLVNLRFQAKNVSHSTTAEFTLEKKAAESVDFTPVSIKTSGPLSVTVNPRPGYSAGIRVSQEEAAVNEKLTVYLNVSANGYDDFNASQIMIYYDSARLHYEGKSDNIYSCEPVRDGVLRIADFGNTEKLTDGVYALDFTAIASGEAELHLKEGECAFSPQKSAAAEDLLQAALIKSSAKVSISAAQYPVTLPDGFSGDKWVSHGKDYTFTRSSSDEVCYEYGPVTASAGGENVPVTENGDGSYTVENVTGKLEIRGTRAPKTFAVHITGSGEKETVAEESAVYKNGYSFTVNKKAGYGYTVTVTIGGKAYTGFTNDGNLYTIPGNDIRGDISITVERKSTGEDDGLKTVSVTVTGNAKEDVDAKAAATTGISYTFTLSKQEDYTYSLNITIDGAPYTGYSFSGTKYTIPGKDVKGNITIRVERTKQDGEETAGQETAGKYKVTVSGGASASITADVGTNAAANGTDYSFTLKKTAGYDYTVTVTIGGKTYSNYRLTKTSSKDSYTIPGKDITGNIVIRVEKTKQEEETYKVTVSGNASGNISADTGADAAAYGEDYSFTLRKTTGYTYTVKITIDGKTYSGYDRTKNSSKDTYTIPGEDITGNIRITATRTQTGTDIYDDETDEEITAGGPASGSSKTTSGSSNSKTAGSQSASVGSSYSGGSTSGSSTVTVSVEGNAAGAVTAAATTALRKDFGFTVKTEEGYRYDVTAYVNGKEVEVTGRENGSYRISAENVTGSIRLQVEKTPEGDTLTITHYLSLNDTELYLLRYSPKREQGSVPCLDGVKMFESPAYGTFALLITESEEPEKEELLKRITFEKTDAITLDTGGDLNMSGHPDAADAEMILDMYNLVYASPSALPGGMELYLRADLNHDGVLNCMDALAAMKLADQ